LLALHKLDIARATTASPKLIDTDGEVPSSSGRRRGNTAPLVWVVEADALHTDDVVVLRTVRVLIPIYTET
jgi:hypothetical protein